MSPAAMPANVAAVVAAADTLRKSIPGVVAVALVGSWARSAGREDSDVDLVVLTTEPATMLAGDSWYGVFGAATVLIRSEDFGLLQERRLLRSDGLEIEVGIGTRAWAALPPDPGTARVVCDGMQVLFDPEGLLAKLLHVVVVAR